MDALTAGITLESILQVETLPIFSVDIALCPYIDNETCVVWEATHAMGEG